MEIANFVRSVILASVFLAIVISAELVKKFDDRDPDEGDTLIFELKVETTEAHIGHVSREIIYPPEGAYNYYNITAVHIHDRHDTTGYYKLLQGGRNTHYAEIKLWSAIAHNIYMTVKIWGKYFGRCNPKLT